MEHETVLFVSQQHHPLWSATSGGKQLRTVRVNQLYQGVLVPPGTTEVELRFLPNVRWMWVSQALIAGAAALLIVRRMRRASA